MHWAGFMKKPMFAPGLLALFVFVPLQASEFVTERLVYYWNANDAQTRDAHWRSQAPALEHAATWSTRELTLRSVGDSATYLQKAWHWNGSARSIPDAPATFAGLDTPTFEIWYRPESLSGGQVIFETGGYGQGLSINQLDDQIVVLIKNHGGTEDPSDVVLTHRLSPGDIKDFIQVVVVTSGTGGTTLYVNPIGETSPAVAKVGSPRDYGSFGGSNIAQLGNANQLGGAMAPSGPGEVGDLYYAATYGPFRGEIGMLRFYNAMLSGQQIGRNYVATIPEPARQAWAFALVLGVVVCMGYARRRNH